MAARDPYDQRREALDREYVAAFRGEEYERWVASLSPAQRRKAEGAGLLRPETAQHSGYTPEIDEALIESVPAHEPSPAGDTGGEEVCAIMISMLSADRPEILIAGYAIALKIPPLTVREVARRHRTTHAMVRRGVEEAEALLDGASARVLQALRLFVGDLAGASNAALACDVFSFVTGIGYVGDSQTDIAKRRGVTRSAVSKRCVELCDRLGLESARGMKSTRSRTVYSAAQKLAWGGSKH